MRTNATPAMTVEEARALVARLEEVRDARGQRRVAEALLDLVGGSVVR